MGRGLSRTQHDIIDFLKSKGGAASYPELFARFAPTLTESMKQSVRNQLARLEQRKLIERTYPPRTIWVNAHKGTPKLVKLGVRSEHADGVRIPAKLMRDVPAFGSAPDNTLTDELTSVDSLG
jgi:SOS-response transcriptional repressor LexA